MNDRYGIFIGRWRRCRHQVSHEATQFGPLSLLPKVTVEDTFPFRGAHSFFRASGAATAVEERLSRRRRATRLRMTNDASFIPTSERSSEGWMSRRMGERKRWDFIPYAMGGLLSDMAVSMIIIIFTIILVPFPISHTHSVILTEIPSKNFNQLVSRDHS